MVGGKTELLMEEEEEEEEREEDSGAPITAPEVLATWTGGHDTAGIFVLVLFYSFPRQVIVLFPFSMHSLT